MTRSQQVADRLKALSDKNQAKLWSIYPELCEWIYYTIGYLEGLSAGEEELPIITSVATKGKGD